MLDKRHASGHGAFVAALIMALPGQGDAAAMEPPLLPTVTVVGKVEQPLSEVAATVTQIDAGQIESGLARDARDLFRFEPGITVGSDPNRFGLGAVNIRGLGGNRVHMETDGVPAPSGFAVGSFSDTGRPFTDLGIVRRVEVLRGPASSLYGSDALAGVIAVTTTRPGDLLAQDGSPAARVRAGYASADEGWYSSLSLAAGRDDWSGVMVLGRRESGAADIAAGGSKPNPMDAVRDSLHASVARDTASGPLGLTATWDRSKTGTQVNSLELSPGRFANTVLLEGDDTNESLRVVVDQALEDIGQFEQGSWRLFWQRAEVEQLTIEERRATSVAAPMAIDRVFDYRESTFGGELTLARTIDAATGSHRLVGGIELARSRIEERRDGLQTNLDTGATSNVLLGESMPVRDFPTSDVLEAGAYLQDEWRPGDGDLAVIAALRADWYRLDADPDALYREDNPGQDTVDVSESSVSPRLGLTWRLAESATAFVQYAHGFRAPPFEDVNIGLDLPQFNVRAIPNPDLEPERSDSLEVGLRLHGAKVSGSLSAWLGRYRDFIQSKVNLGPDPASGVVLFQSQNVGRAEIWGVEAALDASLAALSPALESVMVQFSVAYAHGQDQERDVPLDTVEPGRAVLGFDYTTPSGRGRLAVNVTAVAPKRRVDPTTPDPLRTDGFSTIELTAGWQLSEGWRIDAGIFNITGESYLEWSDVRGRSAADPLLDLYRRPGRHWSVALTAAF